VFKNYTPKACYASKHQLLNVDHSYSDDIFATSGGVVQVWSYERSAPIQSFDTWDIDTVAKLRFNPSETNVLASVCNDRSLIFYDLRGKSALKKVYMKNKSAALCWNPQEPMNIVIGNENSNCYTFDMRKLDEPKMIHKDHLSAVLDIDFSPTGKEFVSAGFDKTIRIFPYNDGRSREVYHTKRMQQVNAILYSYDSRYVYSGSEDTNVRIWKARASDPMKPLLAREKEALAYSDKLKKKYKYNKEVKRILRHRHLPKLLEKKAKQAQVKREARFKKDENMRANNRIEDRPFVPQRKVDMDFKFE
jgi:WD repeat and SOF domain-containing protein 1